MKKLLLSTAILALTAGAALAADLPSRKAEPLLPPPPPPPMWTGFYAGLNAGYGFGTNNNSQSVGLPWGPALVNFDNAGNAVYSNTGIGQALSAWGPQNQNGFIGGAQVGYNYQWGSNVVIGIEADIQGTGIRGSSRGSGAGVGSVGPYPVPVRTTEVDNFSSIGTTNVNAGVDWMGTVRGRLGYLWTPTMLVYATGGLTYGGVYANVNNYAVESLSSTLTTNSNPPVVNTAVQNQTYAGGGNKSQTLVGWNVGGGLEWMFMPNWSLKAEAIYWNMGNMNVGTASFAAASTPTVGSSAWGDVPAVAYGGTRVNYQGVIARAGVNYHFNWGAAAPIVAKY